MEWVWVNSGVGDGQGGLACFDSWGRKESNMTETELNWTEKSDCYEAVTGLSKKVRITQQEILEMGLKEW